MVKGGLLPLVFLLVLGLAVCHSRTSPDCLQPRTYTEISRCVTTPCLDSILRALSWTLSRKVRNRLAHALCGNGPPASKGAKNGGKGEAKAMMPEDPEAVFQQNMQAAVPLAAKLRAQPALLQEEGSSGQTPSKFGFLWRRGYLPP